MEEKRVAQIEENKGSIGEQFVNDLAYSSFMKYWCFANPLDIHGDKKEICDLLVQFNGVLILICVKNYDFKGQYKRYIKRTIEKDIRQLCGAERKIRNSADGIAIKHPDRKEYTKIDIKEITQIHRVTVHFGESMQFYPACDTLNDKFIHVFQKDDFELLMKELDTISDFIQYLDARQEVFFNKIVIAMPDPDEANFKKEHIPQFFDFMDELGHERRTFLIDGGEMDIFTEYITYGRHFREEVWEGDYHTVSIQVGGQWKKFCERDEVKKRNDENKRSFFIDELVKEQLQIGGINIETAKVLLSFNRFDRRVIADSFFDFFQNYNHPTKQHLGRRYVNYYGVGLGFLYYPPYMLDTEDGDLGINSIMDIACDSWMIRDNYNMRMIFIIGVTHNMRQFKFLIQRNINKLSPSEEARVMEDARMLGWFKQENYIAGNIKEFPD